ncbi:MAG TPA: hypothetical protein VMW48_19840 [Vicinamibacterales bacterium]|nr:hypothetical protein [Vicinamibacterales bacterium]
MGTRTVAVRPVSPSVSSPVASRRNLELCCARVGGGHGRITLILPPQGPVHRAYRPIDRLGIIAIGYSYGDAAHFPGQVQPFVMDWLAAAAFDRLPALRARSRDLLGTNHRLFAAWAARREDVAVSLPPLSPRRWRGSDRTTRLAAFRCPGPGDDG